jgi:hypothetical protein
MNKPIGVSVEWYGTIGKLIDTEVERWRQASIRARAGAYTGGNLLSDVFDAWASVANVWISAVQMLLPSAPPNVRAVGAGALPDIVFNIGKTEKGPVTMKAPIPPHRQGKLKTFDLVNLGTPGNQIDLAHVEASVPQKGRSVTVRLTKLDKLKTPLVEGIYKGDIGEPPVAHVQVLVK